MADDGIVPRWIWGVLVTVAGAFINNLGFNLQKAAFLRHERRTGTNNLRPLTDTTWLGGFFFIVIGQVCNFVALGLASASQLAPLGSTSLLSNAVIAPCLLGERFTRKDAAATLLLVCGSTMTTIFGDKTERNINAQSLIQAISATSGIVFAVFLLAVVLITYAGTLKIRHLLHSGTVPTRSERLDTLGRLLRFLMSSLGGIIGSVSVLTGKASAELVENTVFAGVNEFTEAAAFATVGVLAVSMILQYYWINRALKHFDALYVIPTFFVQWTIFSVLGGAMVFSEFENFSVVQGVFFVLGLFVIFVGVYILSKRELHMHASEEVSPASPSLERFQPGLVAGGTLDNL